jgi:hypothetical protein
VGAGIRTLCRRCGAPDHLLQLATDPSSHAAGGRVDAVGRHILVFIVFSETPEKIGHVIAIGAALERPGGRGVAEHMRHNVRMAGDFGEVAKAVHDCATDLVSFSAERQADQGTQLCQTSNVYSPCYTRLARGSAAN